MSDWEKPSGLDALLDDARGEGPSPERLDRVQRRLEAALGASLGPAATDATPAPPRTAAPPQASTLVVVLGPVGAVAVAMWLLARREPPPAPPDVRPAGASVDVTVEHPPVPSGARVPSAPSAAPDILPVVVGSEAPAPSAPRERAPREAVAPDGVRDEPRAADSTSLDPGSTLREEIALLERAMAARDAGDLEGARAALEAHHARFPAGILSPERERLLHELAAGPVAPDPAAPDPPASP